MAQPDAADQKRCPKCGTAMKLEVRPRPATGIIFVAPKQWKCQNPDCNFYEDAP